MVKHSRYMSDCEIRLTTQWYHEDDVEVEEMCRCLCRNKTSVWEHLGADDAHDRGVGRKARLTAADKDRLVKLTDTLVKKADVHYTVTAWMIRASFSPKFYTRTIWNALHEKGV